MAIRVRLDRIGSPWKSGRDHKQNAILGMAITTGDGARNSSQNKGNGNGQATDGAPLLNRT
jgi:hypothetical protein